MQITISKQANKTLARMSANTATLIVAKIEQYAADPTSLVANVKKLKTATGVPAAWRLRVGAWRIIFRVSADRMRVIRIAPRGGAYD